AVILFLPAADYNRSYRLLAEQVGRRISPGACVIAVGVSPPLRAVIAFYGGVHFAPDTTAGRCRVALQPHYRRSGAVALPVDPAGTWDPMWEGQRPARSDESWRLWRLTRRPE